MEKIFFLLLDNSLIDIENIIQGQWRCVDPVCMYPQA